MDYDIVIPGVGGVKFPTQEYTTGNLRKQYEAYMKTIKDIFDKKTPPTAEDMNQLKSAMQGLRKLLLEGDTTTYPGSKYLMTHEMIYNLKTVFDMLDTHGISPDGIDGDPFKAIENWRAMKDFVAIPADPANKKAAVTWGQLLASIVSLKVDPTRSLQSMIELEFIKAGNEYYIGKLDKLAESLEVTKKIINYLRQIEKISNEISVPPTGGFTFPPTAEQLAKLDSKQLQAIATFLGDKLGSEFSNADPAGKAKILEEYVKGDGGKNFGRLYKFLASTSFKNIYPTPYTSDESVAALWKAKQELDKLIKNLEDMGSKVSSTNSLAYFIRQVCNDISNAFKDVGKDDKGNIDPKDSFAHGALYRYIMDNQNLGPGKGGEIQDRITQAMTAAQALNDNQKDELKQVQYIFEQFTRCANTLLQGITKIIEGMGKKMAG